MKRWISLLLIVSLLLLPACKKVSKEWTEQYELGNKYLTDGSYEEAILAFSAAIDVDPNQPDAYVGRGDAHIGRATHLARDGIKLRTEQSRQVIECLQSAQADYQKATDLAAEGYGMTTDPEVLAAKLAQTTERLTEVETAEAAAAETTAGTETGGETTAALRLEYEMREEVIEFRVSDGTLYYSNTINYPYFLGTSAVEATLNQFYAAEIEEFRNTDRDFEAEYREAVSNNYMHTSDLFDNLYAEVTYCKNGAVSIQNIYTMWAGGAHPYRGYSSLNYRIDTGAELTLSDVLIGSEAQIYEAIRSTAAYADIASMYEPDFVLNCPFSLTEEGLCFTCEIGAALPALEVVIPYTSPDTYVIDLTAGQAIAQNAGGNGIVTVEDAFSDTVHYAVEDITCTYAIPRILLNNEPVEAVNSLIYQDFYTDLLSAQNYNSNTYPQGLSYIAYSWGETEELASVLVAWGELHFYTWWNYETYTISKSTGELLTTEQILEVVGLSEEEFYELVADRLEEAFVNQFALYSNDSSMTAQYNDCLSRSIARDNVQLAIPYIDESGDLCVVVNMYTMAGAGKYYHLVNLTGGAEPVDPM